MARGDIFLTDIPYAQGAPGREQAGRRPAIVVQADNPTTPTPTVIVIPATSNVARAQYPYTLLVQPSSMNGLSAASVLLVSQLRAIDRARIGRKIGELEAHYLSVLEAEMRRLLGL